MDAAQAQARSDFMHRRRDPGQLVYRSVGADKNDPGLPVANDAAEAHRSSGGPVDRQLGAVHAQWPTGRNSAAASSMTPCAWCRGGSLALLRKDGDIRTIPRAAAEAPVLVPADQVGPGLIKVVTLPHPSCTWCVGEADGGQVRDGARA